MSKINRYQPHIIVLPEDRANQEIVNGFILAPNVNYRAINIERPIGGWKKVVEKFADDIVPLMRQNAYRRVVLLIDFDKREDRLSYAKNYIPTDLEDRVFILGVQSNPESLRKATKKNFEQLGETLAEGCPNTMNELWEHELLKHNQSELERMSVIVKEILFNVSK